MTDNTEAMKVCVLAVEATSREKIVDVGGSWTSRMRTENIMKRRNVCVH